MGFSITKFIAKCIKFDNATNGFVSDNVQDAIEEVGNAASPAFSLGRTGNCPSGTWLLRVGGPPSNKTGIPIRASNPVLIGVSVGNEDINTFDVEIYEHEGDEINLTLIDTVTITATRTDTFTLSKALTQGRQLAGKIVNGSCKNPGVDFELKGD